MLCIGKYHNVCPCLALPPVCTCITATTRLLLLLCNLRLIEACRGMQLVVIPSMLCLSLCRQKVVAGWPKKTRLKHNQFVSSLRPGGRTLPTVAAGASKHSRAHMCCLLPQPTRVLTPDLWILPSATKLHLLHSFNHLHMPLTLQCHNIRTMLHMAFHCSCPSSNAVQL